MISRIVRAGLQLSLSALFVLALSGPSLVQAQEIRWLRINELQSFISDAGMEYEGQATTSNLNFFAWPAQYSSDQTVMRAQGLWIGCKNFNDPVENRVKSVKVVGSGPRDFDDRRNQIFEKDIRLIARTPHPSVTVDNAGASSLNQYDIVDEVDPTLPCERMVVVRFNTSIGISVTKKVMAFASSQHGNYFIHDYVFKNTGIYNRAGAVRSQTLDSLWFYFLYRFAFAGVSSAGWGSIWGAFSSTWGNTTLLHAFGENPASPEYTSAGSPLRGYFAWYSPHPESNQSLLTYEEDWGCPNVTGGDGTLGSAKYAGCVTLHADAGPANRSDDLSQPRTTWFIGSDIQAMQSGSQSQYDEVLMSDRYSIMREGHPTIQFDDAVGPGVYANTYSNPRRISPSQGQGYGPYTLAPGDSIHIVFAEGVSGISWDKGREVGDNWLKWRNGVVKPTLNMPDGSTTTDHNLYKRRWVETGRDSLLKTYGNALANYTAGYALPKPPPPPSDFTVESGGDRIRLSWANNAVSDPRFGGYVIYRSKGNVLDYRTVYEKIFECGKANAVQQFDDVTAVRGFHYYYYLQSKDDGTQVPGTTLFSSLFWTLTSDPATLQRPAVTATLDSVRIVPNPYDIRGRFLQFGDRSQYDQIAVYGLPPLATLKVFTERGDLIWTKEHTRGTGDELLNSQTSSGQIIASGVYILVVQTPDNRSVIRKFVVIR
jgi:hypothetical protein